MGNLFRKCVRRKERVVCYACENYLVGQPKYDDYRYEWDYEYEEVWECRCKPEEIIKTHSFYCPTCEDNYYESEHLRTVIKDEKVLWLANMITHSRHVHISHWDNKWSNGRKYKKAWGDYETEKIRVNNQQKRQIIRKNINYILRKGIGKEHFLQLQDNDEMTLNLIEKKLI